MSPTEATVEDLALVEHFLNSVDLESGRDDLDSPAALASWMDHWKLLPAGYEPTGADLGRAIEVREALRLLALANNGEDVELSAPQDTLSECASRSALTIEFHDAGSILRPRGEGIDLGLGTILARVYAAMEKDEWRRLKACGKPSCRWAFIDRSKNGSRTWCSMRVCGNRVKATKYRERRAKAGPLR